MKKKTKEIIENVVSTGLDIAETGLNIAGIFVPFVGVIGGGIGLFNKFYARKNFEIFAKKLENLEIRINKLTEEQERNFSFRVLDITNKVLTTRQNEKINSFANIIKNGILTGEIFEDSEEIDNIIDILDKLNLEDIEFLENLYKQCHREFDDGTTFNIPIESDHFQNLHFMNEPDPEPYNHYGFRAHCMVNLQKCIAYGLIEESFDAEDLIKIKDSSYLPSTARHSKYGFKYTISNLYTKMRNYILTNAES